MRAANRPRPRAVPPLTRRSPACCARVGPPVQLMRWVRRYACGSPLSLKQAGRACGGGKGRVATRNCNRHVLSRGTKSGCHAILRSVAVLCNLRAGGFAVYRAHLRRRLWSALKPRPRLRRPTRRRIFGASSRSQTEKTQPEIAGARANLGTAKRRAISVSSPKFPALPHRQPAHHHCESVYPSNGGCIPTQAAADRPVSALTIISTTTGKSYRDLGASALSSRPNELLSMTTPKTRLTYRLCRTSADVEAHGSRQLVNFYGKKKKPTSDVRIARRPVWRIGSTD